MVTKVIREHFSVSIAFSCFASVLGFRGLFCVLGSGFGFRQSGFRATCYHFRVPSLFHVLGSGVGFAIPVSGSAGKCLRISRLVSCPGFRIEISRFAFEGHSRAF